MSEAATNRDRDPAFEKVNDDNRAFLIQCGPIRPSIDSPQTDQGRKKYRFSKNWYNEYDWIEYSLSKMLPFAFPAVVLAHSVSTVTVPVTYSS